MLNIKQRYVLAINSSHIPSNQVNRTDTNTDKMGKTWFTQIVPELMQSYR